MYPSEEEEEEEGGGGGGLDDHWKDYEADKIVSPKQVIYWPNFEKRRGISGEK